MSDLITVRVDGSGLRASLEAARRFTTRTPATAINTAAFFVARAWINEMPRVPVGRIDTELAVQVTPKIGKRGQPLKNKKVFSGGKGGASRTPSVPLAVLIIAARARPGSNYNRITNNRFAIDKHPMAGVSREAGRSAMRQLISTMIGSRHSSIAFLAASIKPIIRALEAVVSPKYRRGAEKMPSGLRSIGDKGHAVPAREGVVAMALISSDIGMVPSRMADKMNTALWRYGSAPLQRAIDQEAARQFKFAAEQEFKELQRECQRIGAAS